MEVRYEKLYFSDEEAEHELLAVVLHVEQLVQMRNNVASPCLPGFVQFGVFIREEPINGVWCGAEYGQDGKR